NGGLAPALAQLRQARFQIDDGGVVGVRARGVVDVEGLAVGQLDAPHRDAEVVDLQVVLDAAFDRPGGYGVDGRVRAIGRCHDVPPYAGITRSGSYGRRP